MKLCNLQGVLKSFVIWALVETLTYFYRKDFPDDLKLVFNIYLLINPNRLYQQQRNLKKLKLFIITTDLWSEFELTSKISNLTSNSKLPNQYACIILYIS